MALLGKIAWRYGLPLLLYSAAVCFITYPLVTDLDGWLAGASYGDAFEYARAGWWANYALRNGLNPFYQSLFGYPDGFFSAAQWSQPLIYLPTAVLNFFLPPAAAYNLYLMTILVLNGMAMHSLCWWLLRKRRPYVRQGGALIGGLILTAYPTFQGNISIGMLNPIAVYAVPIVILCALRILEGERARSLVVIGGVALWLLMLANLTAFIYILMPLALFGGGYFLLRERHLLTRRALLMLIGIAALGGALSLPFYIPLLLEIAAQRTPFVLFDGSKLHHSTDLLALIAPSPFTTWTFAPEYSRAAIGSNSMEGTGYVGILTVALSLIALLCRAERAGMWLLIAISTMVFSLGGMLKVNGDLAVVTIAGFETYIPMPYALFQELPFINVARTPGRFNATTGLALGVLSAYGTAWLLSRLPRPRLSAPRVISALSALILLDYQLFFPFMRHPAPLPAYLSELAARDDVRAVLDVPYDDYVAQKIALWHQVTHRKPMLAGHVWRRPPIPLEKFGLLSDAARGRAFDLLSGAPLSAEAVRALLRAHGVDVVTYHLLPMDDPEALRIGERLFGAPRHVDKHLAFFEVPAADPQVLQTVVPATFGEGWWRGTRRWLTERAALYFYIHDESALRVSIALDKLPYTESVQAFLGGERRAVSKAGQLNVWHFGAPGFHAIQLSAECVRVLPCLLPDEPCAEQAPRKPICASAALQSVRAEQERAWQSADVQLGSGVQLIGFRLPEAARRGSSVSVVTAWRASERLAENYHQFVHLVDQTGALIAQDDFQLGRGAFPTSRWAAGQRWTEAASLALPDDLPEGTYRVFTGWYRLIDGARLPVQGDRLGARDGLVYLGEIRVRP
ncbi:MAG: hypothetical protein J7551_00705 [Chloroflexi bacterium]|nr:hypothetical protein [Chloroflexota bacterium]